MKPLGRKIPIRVAYVGTIVSVYVFSVAMEAKFGVASTGLAEVVIGAVGVAIAGDTYRPSGFAAGPVAGSAAGTGSGKGSGDMSGENA